MKDAEVKIRVSGERKEEWQNRAISEGITLTDLIIRSVEGVPTEKVKVVPTKEGVPTRDSKWGGKPIFKDEKLNKEFYDD